jgi:pyruvate dehydrogenase E2 component (dihydrolipoamide acetyltransferase)
MVAMPSLAEGMEYGLILAWLKQTGEEVQMGEELVEIETDKATMVWASEQHGYLRQLAEVGDSVPVGIAFASLHAGAAEALAEPGPELEPEAAAEPTAKRDDAYDVASVAKVRASPLARRIAREHAIDLTTITGSAVGGRIVRRDVETALSATGPAATTAAAVAAAPVPAAGGLGRGEPVRTPLTRMQSTIAARMTEVKATVPDFGMDVEVDFEAALRLRDELRDAFETAPSVNDMIVKATALALRDHAKMNGAYRDGAFERYPRVNVGIAVAAGDGLVVPTIFDADRLSLGDLTLASRGLAERVRAGTIEPAELEGGTFTVSNLGMYRMKRIFPIIHGGQAGILGVGAAIPRIVPGEGVPVEHRLIDLSLAGDHRILNGTDAATFLSALRDLLEAPVRLLV